VLLAGGMLEIGIGGIEKLGVTGRGISKDCLILTSSLIHLILTIGM